MIRFRNILAAVLFLACGLLCTAARSPERTRSISVADGLSGTTVMAVCQDEFGMIWLGTQDGLNRYDGVNMVTYRPSWGDSTSIYSNNIKSICSDLSGHMYVISKFALSVFDQREDRFHTVRTSDVQAVCCSPSGDVWVAMSRSIELLRDGVLTTLCELPDKYGRINDIICTGSGRLLAGTSEGVLEIDRNGRASVLMDGVYVFKLYEDSSKGIWVCTRRDGAFCISPSGSVTNIRRSSSTASGVLSSDFIRWVCEDIYGNFWLGSIAGVDIYDIRANTVTPVERRSVRCIMRDAHNTMWVAGYGGANMYDQEQDIFTRSRELFDTYGIRTITHVSRHGDQGDIYIATGESGLYALNPEGGGKYSKVSGLTSNNITTLMHEPQDGVMWVGTRLGGLDRVDIRTGDVRWYLGHDNINKIYRYKDRLVVSGQRSVYMLDPVTGDISPVTSSPLVEGKYPIDLFVDRESNCWISVSEGIYRINLETGAEADWFFEDKGPYGTSHITCTYQDSSGRRWFGTSGCGLLLYDDKSGQFASYTTSNSNIPNDYILALTESPSGYLLITTNAGLSRFDFEGGEFQNFESRLGFPITGLAPGVLYVDDKGTVYVADFGSLISFRESRLEDRPTSSNLIFTSVETNGGPAESLLYRDAVDIRGGNPVLEFSTAAMDYLGGVEIEYRIEGQNDYWIKTMAGHKIVCSGLSPGRYTLKIRRCDNHSARAEVKINIHSRWYATYLAKVLYLLVILLASALALNFYRARSRMRQEEEVSKSKLQFFTHISHEIRTPVTLIESQVDNLLQRNGLPPSAYNKISGIKRNLRHINTLLSELLDYRKQELDTYSISVAQGDIVELMSRVATVYKEYAVDQGLDFEFRNDGTPVIPVWYDADQMEKVLYNLLSNAFKNTSPGGYVTLSVAQDAQSVTVKVEDTGRGIAEEYVKHLFEPFYQVPGNGNTGTGLGLAISRGIVSAHHGTITCSSIPGVGTAFEIVLLKGREHFTADQIRGSKPDNFDIEDLDDKFVASARRSGLSRTPVIMIVEDNKELREALSRIFSPLYDVVTASDGQDALDKISSSVPDIILSDLMMPGMDGNELCRRVKGSVSSSHVPFVMITAKVAEESMLESLSAGADDYICKPFNSKILVSKCNNLVSTRLAMQQKFASSSEILPDMLVTNDLDKEFLSRALRTVEANMSDAGFDVNAFASEMALGRTSLFDKIKGVTGMSPGKFITTVRLKYAARMLEARSGDTVSEIAYKVGFNSANYFIRTFRGVYGMTPTAYRDRVQTK